ncbi:MAG: flagellin [Hydrogenoanaerobacterium sp.]
MIIQHNIMALNAHRQLGGNTSNVTRNLEKLSSGFKINRAGDDAAGLAISEKMRAQIKSLDRAKLNAQDGISLIQTAEGALTETHSMLNRLVELATESANGTIKDDDRAKVQDEVKALTDEVDRISKATNFNGINLLDGSLAAAGNLTANIKIGGAKPVETVTPASKTTNGTTGAAVAADNTGAKIVYTNAAGESKTLTVSIKSTGTAAERQAELIKTLSADAEFSKAFKVSDAGSQKIKFEAQTAGKSKATITSADTTGGTAADIKGKLTAGADKSTKYTLTDANWKVGDKVEVGGRTFEFATGADGTNGKTFATVATLITATAVHGIITTGTTGNPVGFSTETGKGLTMQVGDTADDFNKVTVSVNDMSSAGLGLSGLDLGTQEAAAGSLEKIKGAVGLVSGARSTLGSLQNRLDHTINNLGVTSENMTAAESRIRDVDMAKEMMDFTKNNVLTQAAQAMLSQANQQPQQVLQLLR